MDPVTSPVTSAGLLLTCYQGGRSPTLVCISPTLEMLIAQPQTLPGWAIARPGLHFAHPGNVDRPTQTLPGWAIARPGLHFAHPGNVDRPTQTRGLSILTGGPSNNLKKDRRNTRND